MWWRKTPRAFVSSTFLDLRDARRLVADLLVGSSVLPMGMEIFPAAGTGPWAIVRESIDLCDVYILIVAGRYGSTCPDSLSERPGTSWTEVEYDYARACGRPIIALLHSVPRRLPREVVDDEGSRIWEFRKRLENEVLVRYFQDDAELTAGLYQSLIHLRDADRLTVPDRDHEHQGDQSLEEFLRRAFDRRYELVSANWSYALTQDGRAWDATYVGGRAIRAQWPEGIAVLTVDFSHATEAFTSFSKEGPPVFTLDRWERGDSGDVVFRDVPRRLSASSYLHDIDFRPALRMGELCSFDFTIRFPQYGFAFREDVHAASRSDPGGRRDHVFNSFKVNYPTTRLVISCFLPDSLNAEPMGFRVRKDRISRDHEETERIERAGFYLETKAESHGQLGTMMSLDVPDPVHNRRYDLLWRPPRRGSDDSDHGLNCYRQGRR